MNNNELLLKTVFACMSCDGDIAPEEVQLVRKLVAETDLFEGLETEELLNRYIESINKNGVVFLNQYLSEVAENKLTKEEQLRLVDLAIKTIEADNIIQYSEVKFFKKIRIRLSISDEDILEHHPDKEDFLLPDINVAEMPEWNDVTFAEIKLDIEPVVVFENE